ncbi:subfamily C, member 22, variant 2 [Bonamia ostreae]|uniref:Subfamily C, member 22, variant 2 n=1 Tax=Bonamia ostreae TaxID=126728 RepID=A0ABV2AGT5_9EUKA
MINSDAVSAYVCYITSGLFASHLIILERYEHAFLSLISFNFFSVGLIYDFFNIPKYAKQKQKNNTTSLAPEISFIAIFGQIFFGLYFYYVFFYLLPPLRDFENFLEYLLQYFYSGETNLFDTENVRNILETSHSLLNEALANFGIALAISKVGKVSNLDCNFWRVLGVLNLANAFFGEESIVFNIAMGVAYFQYRSKRLDGHKNINEDAKKFIVIRVRYGFKEIYTALLNFLLPKLKLLVSILLFYCSIITAVVFHAGITFTYEEKGDTLKTKYYFRDIISEVVGSDLWKAITNGYNFFSREIQRIGWRGMMDELNDLIVDRMERNKEISAYRFLKIDENASLEEIKGRYRKLALKWHPDKNVPNYSKEEQKHIFLRIQRAYEIIEKRRSEKIKEENARLRQSVKARILEWVIFS